jgi:hypothetical protein
MPDLVKQAGIKQSNGTYEMKDIGVDYENVVGLDSAATTYKAINDKNAKDITTYIAGLSKNASNIRVTDGAGTDSDVNFAMTGATSSAAGAAGFVPTPTTGDVNKFLKGDGTWGRLFDEIYVQNNILYLPNDIASVSDGVLTLSTT